MKLLTQKRETSLGTRFVVLVASILVLTLGITAVVSYRSQNHLFLQQLRTKVTMLGNFTASISPQVILSYDFSTLTDYMRQITREPDVVYAVVLSPDRKNLTAYLDKKNSRIARAINTLGKNDVLSVVKQIKTSSDIIAMEYPIRFSDKDLGFIDIGVSRTRVDELSRHELIRQLTANALIILFLSLCIYIVFRLNALRPIYDLITCADYVAGGNLDHEVPIRAQNELGHLASSFNSMVSELKKSTQEKDKALNQLREFNQTLESRVEERTRELESVNDQLEQLALHDALTGLPNRALIHDRIEQALAGAARNNQPLAIIMMDLDRFKEINDTLGHHMGDELLKEVGSRLHDALRHTDTVGRLGGDEFAIIMPEVAIEGAIQAIKKLLRTFEAPFNLDGMDLSVGASMGVSMYPEHGSDLATLMKRADVAMYVAKHNKLGYFVYDSHEDQHSPSRLSLATELRGAIDNGELELYYQPIVDLKEGQVRRVEALARWQNPHRGPVSPEEFIPLLEQTGMIKTFTRWAIRTAFDQWDQWHKVGINIAIAVNLSMRNLQEPNLPNFVAEVLGDHNAANSPLELEVTESAVMENPQRVTQILTELNQMGVALAIDDFGTGYSSLSYLKKLPVNTIKIDRSFVMNMTSNADDAVIVKSTIDLAHNLGLQVVAEGVEDEDTLELLRILGCDMVQGYLLCRPLPPQEVMAFLEMSWRRTGSDRHN